LQEGLREAAEGCCSPLKSSKEDTHSAFLPKKSPEDNQQSSGAGVSGQNDLFMKNETISTKRSEEMLKNSMALNCRNP